jgi:hypothetical protein
VRVFDLEQLALVQRSLQRSEALVSQSFRIPALPSRHYPYELLTLVDLRGPERDEEAFAHLVIYERQRPNGVEHLYRICVQDDVILLRAGDAGAEWLAALLVYVLTHELVHVVRFQRAEQSFHVPAAARESEEELVHRITLEILTAAGEPHSQPLSGLYGNPVHPARRVLEGSSRG